MLRRNPIVGDHGRRDPHLLMWVPANLPPNLVFLITISPWPVKRVKGAWDLAPARPQI